MPKQLINVIGIVVVVAVLALGIFLVAVPLVAQYFGIGLQTQQVAQTNQLYQQQVDSLTKAKENQSDIDASVEALRAQIPATPQLDSVFELVTKAAQKSKVSINNVAAGDPVPFVVRSAPTTLQDEKKAAPAPSPSPTAGGVVGQAQQTADKASGQAADTNAQSGLGAASTGTATASGRTQIDFEIDVAAKDMKQVTAFLDALRAGPRLLSNITSTVTQTTDGLQVKVTALTFVDTSNQPATKGSK